MSYNTISNNTQRVFRSYQLSNAEFFQLERQFKGLCRKAAWQLLKRNVRNNSTEEFEDVYQELIFAIVHAGVYYKRQSYILACFKALEKAVKPENMKEYERIKLLWDSRKKHGTGRKKFGEQQEKELKHLVDVTLPPEQRPSPSQNISIDPYFLVYAKRIMWNRKKSIGKKITKELPLRSGLASLSEFSYVSFLGKEMC